MESTCDPSLEGLTLLNSQKEIWKACVPENVEIPAVNSQVYYFVQGHIQQGRITQVSLNLEMLENIPHSIPCKVAEVNYVAYGVMTRMMLVPVSQADITDGASEVDPAADPPMIKKAYPVSPSSRIHITRECVRSFFPEAAEGLDEIVECKDVHDKTWYFRLTWWSGPALTDGWMDFVKYKSLLPGDHVVLMRYQGVLRIGTRRGRIGKRDDHLVEGAAEPAAQGLPFVVEYYPCLGTPEFVVSASRVNAAIMRFNQERELGLKPVVSYEDGDTLEIRKCVSVQDLVWGPYNSAHWPESPWRCLQVYVPELKWVSPWEVNRYVEYPIKN